MRLASILNLAGIEVRYLSLSLPHARIAACTTTALIATGWKGKRVVNTTVSGRGIKETKFVEGIK